MAEPISPVFEELVEGQIILGAGNTDAMPLPVFPYTVDPQRKAINMISKWKLSERELEEVKKTGCVYLIVAGQHPPVKIFGHVFLVNGIPSVYSEPDPLEQLADK
jgi:hypothetical protein